MRVTSSSARWRSIGKDEARYCTNYGRILEASHAQGSLEVPSAFAGASPHEALALASITGVHLIR